MPTGMGAVRDVMRAVRAPTVCLAWRALEAIGLNRGSKPPVAFVVENADWSVRWDGDHVCAGIERVAPGTAATTIAPARLVDHVVHFGSQYMWLSWGAAMARSNRFVATYFHGKPEDGPDVARHIDAFLESVPRLSRVVVANTVVENRLIRWGAPRDKIVRIPIGVDTRVFVPPSPEERHAARARFGISDEQIVVGSFQKDGIGWGDGMEPKRIKGPDVFLAAVERLASDVPLFVLLTGPARGYVKRKLECMGVPFAHTYVNPHERLVECYHALDLYLVTSREEGGPKALIESMASGVPVVSTAVGMAPDLIDDGVNGGLVESEDVEGLCTKALRVLHDPTAADAMRAAARTTVKLCDWDVVAQAHFDKVYRPLL